MIVSMHPIYILYFGRLRKRQGTQEIYASFEGLTEIVNNENQISFIVQYWRVCQWIPFKELPPQTDIRGIYSWCGVLVITAFSAFVIWSKILIGVICRIWAIFYINVWRYLTVSMTLLYQISQFKMADEVSQNPAALGVQTHLLPIKMDAISQTTFSNAFSLLKSFVFRFQFHWGLFRRVQLAISRHWFG